MNSTTIKFLKNLKILGLKTCIKFEDTGSLIKFLKKIPDAELISNRYHLDFVTLKELNLLYKMVKNMDKLKIKIGREIKVNAKDCAKFNPNLKQFVSFSRKCQMKIDFSKPFECGVVNAKSGLVMPKFMIEMSYFLDFNNNHLKLKNVAFVEELFSNSDSGNNMSYLITNYRYKSKLHSRFIRYNLKSLKIVFDGIIVKDPMKIEETALYTMKWNYSTVVFTLPKK
ncbi:MAG: hypothetical protein ACOCRK_00585 [bacterium]